MSKFKCSKCNKEIEISNYTVKIVKDKLVTPEAVCCDNYMDRMQGEFNGWGSIRRGPDGTVKRKPRPWE